MSSDQSVVSRARVGLATTALLFAGTIAVPGAVPVVLAAEDDVTTVAGGPTPYGVGNPVGPVAGDEVWFSVYAENIEEHAGSLYIRDIEGISKVDATTGVTQRIAGVGYGQGGTYPLPADGVPAAEVGIGWGRSLAVGPDEATYFTTTDGNTRGTRIYRVDPDSGLLGLVAGDGSDTKSGDGGPALDAGLGLDYLGVKDGLFVDASNSIWFVDGTFNPLNSAVGIDSIRRVDAATEKISTVYQYPQYPPMASELLGFTPDGAAYVAETTYATVAPFDAVSTRTVRIDSAGTTQIVTTRTTGCDDRIAAGDARSSHQWVDNGVRSVALFDTQGTTTLCTIDLATGVAATRTLTGAITEFLAEGPRGILASSITTTTDGTSFFVGSEGDGTYKVHRWEGPSAVQPPSFVTRNGTRLMYNGQEFRFTGMNLYDANNTGGCGGQYGSGGALGAAIDQMGGPQVLRSWFFQPQATTGGVRNWAAFDHTLAVAQAKGVKVIAALGNQWKDCDGANGGAGRYKTATWYSTGYQADVDPGMVVSYRAWVAEVVARYRDNPTIMAWEILNEPEVKVREPLPGNDPGCAANADSLLYNFAADITGLIKSLDPNHLVSLGTIGGGQCGSDNAKYSTLHAIAGIDLCSVHDYDRPDDAIAGDQFNGIAIRMRQCRDLGKPIFVGEAGLTLPQTAGSTTLRAQKLNAKLLAEFRAGTVGYMFWGWANPPRAGVDIHDIGPGDPMLSMLTVPSSTWPYDGGDTDNDGVSNAIDSGAGWDDHQGTTGAITDANGLSAVVLDAPAPGGVTIFVPGVGSPPRPMKLSSCGTTVEIDSGSSATLTCGSVTAQVMTGRVRVRLSADTFVEIPAGTTAKVAFSANGAFTVSDIVGSGVRASVEGVTTSLASGGPPQSFAAWTFTGFAFPISNTARNSVTAGQTVHLGWLLRDPSGKPVTTLRQVTIRVTGITPCPGGRVVADGTPVTFTLNHGLYYLGLGVYILEWTTPKVYKGSCKLMRLDLGEGVTRNASFTFK